MVSKIPILGITIINIAFLTSYAFAASILYIGFVLENINNTIYTFTVPAVSMPCTDLPPGLILLPDYVNDELEQQLLELVNWCEQDSLTDVTAGIIK